MELSHTLLLFLLLSLAVSQVSADALVVGSVFCDRCKDGHLSLFDYPMIGIKVTVSCEGDNGQLTRSEEGTTNWLGSYAVWVSGSLDLSNCYAQVTPNGQSADPCMAVAGPAQPLNLVWTIFEGAMYRVDSLLTQPASPMSFCPHNDRAAAPSPEAFACTSRNWTVPEHRCYWRAISPETKVAVVFGVVAAERYGWEMTVWEGLQGKGDPYKALLREGTAALLNSYKSDRFPSNTVSVMSQVNLALLGSEADVLRSALKLMRYNSGSGPAACDLTPCN